MAPVERKEIMGEALGLVSGHEFKLALSEDGVWRGLLADFLPLEKEAVWGAL